MGMTQEFKDFAMRGNVVDMAVGIVIGGSFGKIVSSFVGDIIMPPIGMVTGRMDFSNMAVELQAAATDGAGNAVDAVTLNYGSFISVAIDFVIIAFAIFMVVKAMNSAKARMEKEEEEKPADPPKPSDEVVLLTEIRDALKSS